MNEIRKTMLEIIRLEDNDSYFSMDDNALSSLQSRLHKALFPEQNLRLEPNEDAHLPEMLAISGPSAIDLEKNSQLPVLIASSQNGLRRWEVNYHQNAWMVAVDQFTGALSLLRPFISGKTMVEPPRSMSGERPDRINAGTIITSAEIKNLSLPLMPDGHSTRLALTLIVYDWMSNTILIDVKGTEKLEEYQPVSKAENINLSISSGTVKGRFSIQLPSSASVGDGNSAVLPASLIAVQKDTPMPFLLNMNLPVSSQNGLKIGDSVQGDFELELQDIFRDEPVKDSCQLYLFIGETAAGPYSLHP